ncbi:uncharacterized protein LOC103709980 [Phoenix dactylifera]|uniref:Uncharacterized protein LOC103709980 n=1 Tax=Phoenix dactylifera TaxID=42345 RepID=A0A8B7C848_PHODC|nr:uncharacterized protein LOC103709980 [Phoenix dactylifera]
MEGASAVDEINKSLVDHDQLLKELKENLEKAWNCMKQQEDWKWRKVIFEEGDWVYLKLPPYRQQTVFRQAYQKLAQKYFAPYQITERIGSVAYRLALPKTAKVHPVFHVSLLKRKMGEGQTSCTDLPSIKEDGNLMLEPELVKDYRWVRKGGKLTEEIFV